MSEISRKKKREIFFWPGIMREADQTHPSNLLRRINLMKMGIFIFLEIKRASKNLMLLKWRADLREREIK